MPDLIDGGCKKLEKQYKDEIVIFFLDEIIAFGNPHSLDWRTLTPGPSINLLLAFSPIGLERGPKQVLSTTEDVENETQSLRLPTTCEVVNLHLRYRNTKSIQNFTRFIGHKIGNYLTSCEKPATDIDGNLPVWIDVNKDKKKILPALHKLKKYIEHDRKSNVFLLYDIFLSEEIKQMLNPLAEPRSKGGFGWKVMEEKPFHGHECDIVFYVGSGHLEAFTRALVKLFIVTLTEGDKRNPWYKTYQSALNSAFREKIIKKDILF